MALKLLPPKREKTVSSAEQSQRANRTVLRRTLFLMILCGVVLFIPLIFTLYRLMIVEHDKYEELAINNQTRYTNLTASRGVIYDRNMNVLATSATVETVFIDPNEIATEMKDPANSNLLDHIARGLSEILDVETSFIYEQAADTAYRYKVIRRKISEELADQVREFINENEIKGVYLETDAQRYYPYSSLAAQVLGFVSRDNVGQEGLEAYYDSLLQGTAGKVVTYLEKNLQNAIDKYGILNGAFGIVMDVNTGGIVAMSTMGSYDPNHYQDVYDEETAQALEEQYQKALLLREGSPEYDAAMKAYNEAVAAARLKQWRNRCVSDGYEPGSTFKLVTMAAALDSGSVTVNDSFYCGGHEDFKGRDQTLSCWKSAGHGAETLEEALGNSCNIAFGHIGLRIGGEEFYDYINSFGFLEQTGVDLPGEAKGLFFSKADLSGASTASLISASFGQTFRITPIQLVRAVAAIVNGGYLLEPHVVSTVLDADGNVVRKNERTVLRQVISEETSATMREFMEFVVTDGTASNAYTPGYRVGGKTGTSEKIDEYDENGKPVDDKIVSFIGVAPINDPQYVVLVALDTPEYVAGTSYTPHNQYISGSLMGAPTVRDIFSDILPYLGVEPDYSSDDIRGVNITLPDVIGKTESEAKSITYRTVGNGSVVTDQLPSAGQEVPGHSEIVLYMGEEKVTEKTTVPNFIGYGVADVNWLANQYGLYIQAKGTDRTDVYVSAAYQDIPEGTEVDKGTTITVEFTTGGASD